MILTTKQEEGLKIAVARYEAHEAYTCIAGYAGTGKSTLIKFIIAALGLYPEDVCYVAYTGKAAQVLRQKGCPNAVTAHKLLYKAKPMPNGTYVFIPKSTEEIECGIIIVDEVSMLPREMWQLLLSHGIHVLATGDPFQLPPINPDEDNHVLDKPHIFLDEIMRQAAESEIIRLSMHIRDGKPVGSFPVSNNQVRIYHPEEIVTGMYSWADQMICATNNIRHDINRDMRKIKGFGETPEVGDKIISLRNQWNFVSDSPLEPQPLTNGTICTIEDMQLSNVYVPYWIYDKAIPTLYTTMTDDATNERFIRTPIDYNTLLTGQKTLTGKQEYQIRKLKKVEPPFEFAYAYAITCHKAQGSEWDKVLVFEENFPFTPEEHARWLYTAVTRASEKVVLVTKGKWA